MPLLVLLPYVISLMRGQGLFTISQSSHSKVHVLHQQKHRKHASLKGLFPSTSPKTYNSTTN
jgi:hypothetical protein